jgi:tRNA threonylcarbamoyl adenosine modification protein (Sua5/YciO/YrdC/YwlC family)
VNSPGPVEEAVAAARRGALIVLPTDTVYGIGTRPDDPAATARLFAAKHRSRDLTLPVLVATVAQARTVAELDDRAERLALACWPGALTMVLPRTARSAAWDLGGDATSVGVRIPDHPLALAVLAGTGPLAVTSANRSGSPPVTTGTELAATFGEEVEVYLSQDEPLAGAASTVISLLGRRIEVLRVGDLDAEAIERLSAG